MSILLPEGDPKCPKCADPRPVMHLTKTLGLTETWVCPLCKQTMLQHVYTPTKAQRSLVERPLTLCAHCKEVSAETGDHLCTSCRMATDFISGVHDSDAEHYKRYCN